MGNEYKIGKIDDVFELKRMYTKEDNTEEFIEVAKIYNIIEFNNFIEKATTNRLNEFLKEHHIR